MTNFDPTTNRIPFFLLTPEEREALMSWPHGWEYLYYGRTEPMSNPANYPNLVSPMSNPANYPNLVSRGKPAPKKITYYCNVYDNCIGIDFSSVADCKRNIGIEFSSVANSKRNKSPFNLGILQVDIINDTPTFTFIPKDKTND
jgi:hypothetical protein